MVFLRLQARNEDRNRPALARKDGVTIGRTCDPKALDGDAVWNHGQTIVDLRHPFAHCTSGGFAVAHHGIVPAIENAIEAPRERFPPPVVIRIMLRRDQHRSLTTLPQCRRRPELRRKQVYVHQIVLLH